MKHDPKGDLFHTKCTFEVLVDGNRLLDFTISYVAKLVVSLSAKQKLLKDLQAKNTKSELDKFLERAPIRHNSTIERSRRALHAAKETAGDVKHTLEDRYTSEEQVPLTSRTTERRRAFSDLRAATRSHIELAPHLKKHRRSSDTSEEKEMEDKKGSRLSF